jgi:hypothetical protein
MQEQNIEQPKQDTVPNEVGGVSLQGHIKIFDP